MIGKEIEDIETKKVITFFLQHKTKFIISITVAVLLSAGITFFTPSEYSSFGVIYPPSSTSLENAADNPNFGYDVEADRVIQIFQSQAIKDSVIKKFDLYHYFKVEPKDVKSRDALIHHFSKTIKFERTTSMSVIISARTKDPEMSANMVNYIIDKTNELREHIYKQNVLLAYSKINDELLYQKHISDSLSTIVKKELAKLNLSGLMVLATNSQLNFNELAKNSSIENSDVGINIINYQTQLNRERDIEDKLFKTRKALEIPIPKLYIIDKGLPSYNRVAPSLSANCLIAAALALIVTAFFLIIKQKNN